jgi:hypothetical protein
MHNAKAPILQGNPVSSLTLAASKETSFCQKPNISFPRYRRHILASPFLSSNFDGIATTTQPHLPSRMPRFEAILGAANVTRPSSDGYGKTRDCPSKGNCSLFEQIRT